MYAPLSLPSSSPLEHNFLPSLIHSSRIDSDEDDVELFISFVLSVHFMMSTVSMSCLYFISIILSSPSSLFFVSLLISTQVCKKFVYERQMKE